MLFLSFKIERSKFPDIFVSFGTFMDTIKMVNFIGKDSQKGYPHMVRSSFFNEQTKNEI